MTDRSKDAQPEGEDADDTGGGGINDPLTRRDVEAPRVPFESSPPADE